MPIDHHQESLRSQGLLGGDLLPNLVAHKPVVPMGNFNLSLCDTSKEDTEGAGLSNTSTITRTLSLPTYLVAIC